jgi:hypothetical protein
MRGATDIIKGYYRGWTEVEFIYNGVWHHLGRRYGPTRLI